MYVATLVATFKVDAILKICQHDTRMNVAIFKDDHMNVLDNSISIKLIWNELMRNDNSLSVFILLWNNS